MSSIPYAKLAMSALCKLWFVAPYFSVTQGEGDGRIVEDGFTVVGDGVGELVAGLRLTLRSPVCPDAELGVTEPFGGVVFCSYVCFLLFTVLKVFLPRAWHCCAKGVATLCQERGTVMPRAWQCCAKGMAFGQGESIMIRLIPINGVLIHCFGAPAIVSTYTVNIQVDV